MGSDVAIFGSHEPKTIAQLERCASVEDGARAVLCADGHLGYSMPIGGVGRLPPVHLAVGRRLRHR